MGRKPCPLPSRALAVVAATVAGTARIKGSVPVAFRIPAAHEAGSRVKIVTVILSFFSVLFGFCFVAGRFRKLRYAPVVVGVFKTFSHRLELFVPRYVAKSVFIIL